MTQKRPPGRYQSTARTRPGKFVTWGLTALVIIAGAIIAYVAYNKFAVKEIDTNVVSFDLMDDSTVDIHITVTRADPSRPAVCIIRARSKDGSETGRREVYVAPSDSQTVELTAPVRTSHPPAVGDVYGCSFDVPGYLRTS